MKTKLHFIGFASALLCLLPVAHAATNTWTGLGGDNFWTTAANWNNNILPVGGNVLLFPSGAARLSNTNNFGAGAGLHSIVFTGGGYTLRGLRLYLAAGIQATHASGLADVRLPIQLAVSQTFSNSPGLGTLRFFDVDLNGHDLTLGAGGEIQQGATGAIFGEGSVIKTGTANLFLGSNQSSNSYTGATEVRQGTLFVSSDDGLGATNGSTTVLAGATLEGSGTFTNAEPLVLQGTFRIGGSSFGTNIWTGPVTLMATNVSVQPQGGSRADLNGVVSGSGGLNKSGPGALVLNAANTYTGSTTNSAGILVVNGHQPQSPVTITAGTLGGTGTVGTLTATGALAKTLAPGGSPGILNSSNVTLNSSTTFRVELNGTIPGGGYDQLNVNGSVSLGSCVLSNSLGYAPAVGDHFTIINNDGADAVVGTFSGLPQGAVFTNSGAQFSISYTGGDGNDVVLYRGIPPAQLTGITPLTNGMKQIQGLGLSNLTYTIQAATNLNPVIVWSNLGTALANGSGQFFFTDTNAPLFPMRFYRVLSP